jgi:hypothetical protein
MIGVVDWLQPAGATPPPSSTTLSFKLQAPTSAASVHPTSATSASVLTIPATILTIHTFLTIHAPRRWLALRLLLRVARLHTASLPLALSLRRSKLEVKSGTSNAVQTVFTLWTDKLAMQSAKPSQYDDFYTVEPNAEDETDADETDADEADDENGR